MNRSHAVIGARKGRSSSNQWGIDGYYVPNNEWHFDRPRTFWSKMKKENFMEEAARKKKDLPAPTAYKLKSQWSGHYSDGGGHSGRWLKAPKVTMIDEILKQKKNKPIGPG